MPDLIQYSRAQLMSSWHARWQLKAESALSADEREHRECNCHVLWVNVVAVDDGMNPMVGTKPKIVGARELDHLEARHDGQ
jgi:hypothetical protein